MNGKEKHVTTIIDVSNIPFDEIARTVKLHDGFDVVKFSRNAKGVDLHLALKDNPLSDLGLQPIVF